MKRLVFIAVIAAGTGLFFGCGGGEDDNGGESSQFPIPLSIGNWWFSQNPNDSSDWDTMKIVQDTVYNGHDGFLAVEISSDPPESVVLYYGDGFLNAVSKEDSTVMEMKYFKQDMAVGDTWTVFEMDTTIDSVQYSFKMKATVVSQEDITVPAGSFNACYKIVDSSCNYANDSLTEVVDVQYMWLAYGTGIALGYSEDSTGTPSDTSELVDYHIE